MKKFFFVFVCIIFFEEIKAQGYIPQVGETIVFYNLTEKAKQEAIGYDCFYSTEKVLSKKNTYKFKDSFRYKCNENRLTPFSEIEGKDFLVLKSEKYTHNGKDKNLVFLLFLKRLDDDSEAVLRIPFHDEKTSPLTKSFLCEKIADFGYYKRKYLYINMPCIISNYVDSIAKIYKGKELFYKNKYNIVDNKGNDDYNAIRQREKDFKYISSELNDNIYNIDENILSKCIDVKFEESRFSQYIHPFAICTYVLPYGKEEIIKLPLTYLSGNNNLFNHYYWSNKLFENYFTLKSEKLEELMKDMKCLHISNKFTGKYVYYGLDNKYNYDGINEASSDYNAHDNITLNNKNNYKLSEGSYKCIKFDVFKKENWGYIIDAILEDSLGVQFRVPATPRFSGTELQSDFVYRRIYPDKHYSKSFEEYFMLLDDAIRIKEERRIVAIKKAEDEKKEYASWVKKYGSTYAQYMKTLTNMELEKFIRLVPKYGKPTAKMMVQGKVRLGWTEKMCIESWGKPDDINSTIGSWGTHEQWVYGEIYCSYLYFENGILTSIQN